jgi:hypothetical protein
MVPQNEDRAEGLSLLSLRRCEKIERQPSV